MSVRRESKKPARKTARGPEPPKPAKVPEAVKAQVAEEGVRWMRPKEINWNTWNKYLRRYAHLPDHEYDRFCDYVAIQVRLAQVERQLSGIDPVDSPTAYGAVSNEVGRLRTAALRLSRDFTGYGAVGEKGEPAAKGVGGKKEAASAAAKEVKASGALSNVVDFMGGSGGEKAKSEDSG